MKYIIDDRTNNKYYGDTFTTAAKVISRHKNGNIFEDMLLEINNNYDKEVPTKFILVKLDTVEQSYKVIITYDKSELGLEK